MLRENQKILSSIMVISIHDYSSCLFFVYVVPEIHVYYSRFFVDDQFPSEQDEEVPNDGGDSLVPYASDEHELSLFHDSEEAEEEEQTIRADLGGGWGRIIYSPIRRGKQVQMDVCRATKRDASEGTFERVVVTKSKNPTLHFQARRSLWGDLWPF